MVVGREDGKPVHRVSQPAQLRRHHVGEAVRTHVAVQEAREVAHTARLAEARAIRVAHAAAGETLEQVVLDAAHEVRVGVEAQHVAHAGQSRVQKQATQPEGAHVVVSRKAGGLVETHRVREQWVVAGRELERYRVELDERQSPYADRRTQRAARLRFWQVVALVEHEHREREAVVEAAE